MVPALVEFTVYWGGVVQSEISYVSIHSPFPPPPLNTYTIRQIAACSKRKRGNYTEWMESRLSLSVQMCSDVRVWNRCREGSKPLESKKIYTLFSGRTCFSDASLDRHVSVLVLVGNKNFNPIKVMSESAHCTRSFSRYMAQWGTSLLACHLLTKTDEHRASFWKNF